MLDIRRYLRDLDGWLALQEPAGGGPRATITGATRERADEIFRDDVLRPALAQLLEPEPALAWLLLEAAGDWRLADRVREPALLAQQPWPCGAAGPPAWDEAGYWLAATPAAPQRRAVRGGLEAVGERVDRAEAEVALARQSLLTATGMPPAWELWQRARRRQLADTARAAARLLALAGDPPVPPAPEALSWVDLPAALAAAPGDALLPPLDAQLLAFVAAELGGADVLEQRLEVRLDAAAPPRAGVAVVEPASRVRLWLRPLAPARDYRVALRLLGRALSLAAAEDASGARARAADPAVPACYGALLESLTLLPTWRQRLLRRAAPAAVAEALAGQIRLQLRLLAAEVVAAARAPAPPAPWRPVALGEEGLHASGFVHPRVPLPWSHRAGESVDAFAGCMLGAELEERLASRFGRDWIQRPAAGRYLRDLWAAAHPTAADLAADLGIRGLGDVELLFERRFRQSD